MENGNPLKKKLQTSSVISVFVFLADIYFIVNMKSNYAILGVAALATLFCILSTINAWTKWKEADSQRAEEHYVDIMKAEKSTHLVSQKSFQNLDEKLNFIGQKIMPLEKASSANQKKMATMLENLMDGQKKVAKVTISRSKENATALMNSNDQLIQRMEEFQQSILDMKTEVLEKQDEIYNKKLQRMDDNHKELVDKIQESTNMFQDLQRMDDNHKELVDKIQESTNMLQNLQRMDDTQKELAEKIQESAELFQNLRKVDDNQRELVEKIQESTDLIKNIIEVIPDKIAQMPQLAQREPYTQNAVAVNDPFGAGQEVLPEMAGEEVPEDGLMAEPIMEIAGNQAHEAVGRGMAESVAEPEQMGFARAAEPEQMELQEPVVGAISGELSTMLPESIEEPEVLSGAELIEVPEELPNVLPESVEPPEVLSGAEAEMISEVLPEAEVIPEVVSGAEAMELPEILAGVGEIEAIAMPESVAYAAGKTEAIDGAEFIEAPEVLAGIESIGMPETAMETEAAELPEVLAGAESIGMPEVAMETEAAELPEVLAGAESIGLPEAIAGAGKPESIAMPEPEPVAIPKEIAEPELVAMPEKMAELEPVAMPEEITEPEPVAMPEKITEPELVAMPEEITEPELVAMPKVITDMEEIGATESTVEQELAKVPIEAASPELVADVVPIEPPITGIGPALEEMPEIMADAAPVSMELPQEILGTQPQAALTPDQIPTVGPANGMMTPEDIAALLASTAEPEPEPELEPIPAPFMGNGDGIMSPEEIAALIGNTAVEELPKMANRIDDGIKPPLPDMSDPGKMLSPEDIASLIANM